MSFNETIFGKYPSDWKLSNLGDLISIITDYHANGSYKKLKENVELKDDEDYAIMIRTTNFEQDNFNPSDFKYISKDAYEFLTKTKVFENDLLMNKIANAGSVYKMPKVNKPVSLAMNLFLIRADEEKLDKVYMYYFLKNYEKYIKTYAEGSVTKTITKENVRRLKIAYPSQIEQKAICNILSNIENKIKVNNKINQKLEEIAQSIFKQWFIDFDFPNEEGKPYKSSGGEMVESELGMIPKGWEVIRLEDIAKIKTTSVKPQNSENTLYEHYSIPAYDNNKYPVFEEGKYIKSNKYKVYKNSILISKLNPDTKRVWKPIVLTDNAICSTEFINYVPRDIIFESLIYSIIDSKEFTDYLCQHVTGSTGSRQRANPKSSYNYQIAITKDNDKMKLFSSTINCINLRIRNNRIEVNKLIKLRDTLLPKLMSGEIRVLIDK